MIVRDQDHVDWRQLFECQRRREEALWTEPLRRSRAFVPHRIYEDTHAIDFDKRGRVTEPGDAEAGCGTRGVNAGIGVEGTEWVFRDTCR